MSLTMNPPFAIAEQLTRDLDKFLGCADTTQNLPGYPRIPLNNRRGVYDFLEKELCSADLDRVASKLWMMSKQDSANISPLHRQVVKMRTIVVTEDPKLHLVWFRDRIFIKPLPRYLLSHTFWAEYICDKDNDVIDDDIEADAHRRRRARIRRAALGYLRTYALLIRYESDLRIAQEAGLQLVPRRVTWAEFCSFISRPGSLISDRDVSPRYAFGEIRLTRLNFYAPLFLHKSYYQRMDHQYGAYFSRFYGPVLFAIGVVTVILGGLQVAVAVQQQPDGGGDDGALFHFAFWFSIVMIVLFSTVSIYICALFSYKVIKEWKYAIHDKIRLLEEGRTEHQGKSFA